jgi:hypothetical protein
VAGSDELPSVYIWMLCGLTEASLLLVHSPEISKSGHGFAHDRDGERKSCVVCWYMRSHIEISSIASCKRSKYGRRT